MSEVELALAFLSGVVTGFARIVWCFHSENPKVR